MVMPRSIFEEFPAIQGFCGANGPYRIELPYKLSRRGAILDGDSQKVS
jgi:hypothetical protein